MGGSSSTNTPPPPVTHTIGGTVSGLAASGLLLQNNLGDNLTVAANATSFTFSTPVQNDGAYSVTILTQPTGETCSVANATGTAIGNVTNVAVTCSTITYTIGGTITGLTASGLVLQDNLSNNLTVLAGATSFTFSAPIPSGGTYSVTVLTQPTGQNCLVTNGSGTANANVTSVVVTCNAITYTIGGTITGLTASGLVLQDNLTNNLTVLAGATSFTFSAPIPSGGSYSVTLLTQPTGQNCLVTNGSGTANANVTSVVVTCSAITYTIGGTITGLTASGLVLQDNLTDNLTVAAGATAFTFATPIPSGGTYRVTVLIQPAGQTCSVTAGSGTANGNVTSVVVTCSAITYTIGGTITGLTGSGLVLQDNLTDNLTVTAGATSFTFHASIPSGGTYSVTVLTQPAGQNCLVTSGSGTANANVTSVVVTCSAATYTIGGTITGLTGSGLVLQDNLTDNLTVTAGATSFTFTTPIPNGGAYSVTVLTQPSNPKQSCAVANANGTATGNVTDVAVTCSTNQWTWQNGANFVNQGGSYASNPKPTNVPGARYGAVTWIDASGGLWLFGGYGFDSDGGNNNYLNDLWKFSAGEWTWMSGSDVTDANGVYGTGGDSAPGAREAAVSWTDSAGNLWLFGGYGFDSDPNDEVSQLNDLWKYAPSTNQWAFVGGSEFVNQGGTYGIKGSPDPGNVPGARLWASASSDSFGNFWLFGGYGYDSNVNNGTGSLNDLWEFSTSTLQWTWISGANVLGQSPTYGDGSAAPGNVPGAREGLVSWIDSSGNFWLFGGNGLDSNSVYGYLNDVWEYFPTSQEWEWVSGGTTNIANEPGNYVALGQTGIPGGRMFHTGWFDSSGNFWLFGGQQFRGDQLNDLWKYTAGQWTWISGSSSGDQFGTYGTLGTSAPGNTPGARQQPFSWIDAHGNLWLSGGYGFDSASISPPDAPGALNDLWEYQP